MPRCEISVLCGVGAKLMDKSQSGLFYTIKPMLQTFALHVGRDRGRKYLESGALVVLLHRNIPTFSSSYLWLQGELPLVTPPSKTNTRSASKKQSRKSKKNLHKICFCNLPGATLPYLEFNGFNKVFDRCTTFEILSTTIGRSNSKL